MDTGTRINHAYSDGCRGPEQLARGQADRSGAAPISETGRKMLTDLMREGLGDHVLLLRLYQASGSCIEDSSLAECSGPEVMQWWRPGGCSWANAGNQVPFRVLPEGTVGTDTRLTMQD